MNMQKPWKHDNEKSSGKKTFYIDTSEVKSKIQQIDRRETQSSRENLMAEPESFLIVSENDSIIGTNNRNQLQKSNIDQIEEKNDKCQFCGNKKQTVNHIIRK